MSQKYETYKGRKVFFIESDNRYTDCVKCAFVGDLTCDVALCEDYSRADGRNGHFIDYVETETQPTKHVHHDMIVAWAADPSQTVEFSHDGRSWCEIDEPSWTPEVFYRFKPKTITRDVFLKIRTLDDDFGVSFVGKAHANLKVTFVDGVLTKSVVL